MAAWLSYSLHDLLIFSPDSYIQLYELSNQSLWSWHIPILGLTFGALFIFQSKRLFHQRLILLWLAGVWLFVGYWFIDGYYSQIFKFAHWLSLFFYLQALLLFVFAALPSPHISPDQARTRRKHIAWVLIVGGYLIYPLMALWFWGQNISSLQIFSVAPDPTTIATLGFLVTHPMGRGSSVLFVIPLLWVLFSFLTHLAFAG